MSTIYIREQGQLVPLDIPEYKGDKGEAGQTPDLQVGSVTALPNDQQASVTIQGNKENPTINFGLPSGETGDKGLYVGRPEDAYDETKVVFDDENWIDDTYFENSTVDYMGGEHESLKEKSDSDIEYILRKFGTQHYEGSSITATNTYAMQVKSAIFKGVTKYKDKATGEIIDSFQEGRNLELVSVKSPVLTITGKNLFTEDLLVNKDIVINIDGKDVYKPIPTSDGNGAVIAKNGFRLKNNIFKPSTQYVLSFKYISKGVFHKQIVYKYTDGFSYQSWGESSNGVVSYTTMPNRTLETITVMSRDFNGSNFGIYDIQLEESNVLTAYEPYKSHTLTTPSDLILRGIGNTQDMLDLNTGEYNKRIETRPYQQGDESNADVLTDKVNTIYKLAQPIINKVDLKGQKIYSYDGTTHYTTSSSLEGHPNPILSIDVPTNITSLLKHQQNTINRQRLVLSEREEMQNILIESMLYRYEQSTLLNDTIEVVPDYIQKLYEVAYQRGIRFRKEE